MSKKPVSTSEQQTSNSDHAPVYDSPTVNPEPRALSHLPHCDPDEINLLDYLRVIFQYKWMILFLTVVAMAVTVVLSMRQPRMYQASTSIVPPLDTLSQGRGLAGKLGGAGSMLLQGMLNEGDLSGLYLGILESRAVSEALIDRFDLMKVYAKVKTRTDAQKTLRHNTTMKASKEGIVHVTVKDLDPKLAASIANAYVEELDRLNKKLSGSQITSKRVFLENRLKEIQDELSQIDSLQSHEAQIKEMLFELLAQECELAKIEEAKSMPTIQVLDPAIIPERPIARGTVSKGIVVGFAAFMGGIFMAFVLEYATGIRAGCGG